MKDKERISLLEWYSTLLLIRQQVVEAKLSKTTDYLDEQISKVQKTLNFHIKEV